MLGPGRSHAKQEKVSMYRTSSGKIAINFITFQNFESPFCAHLVKNVKIFENSIGIVELNIHWVLLTFFKFYPCHLNFSQNSWWPAVSTSSKNLWLDVFRGRGRTEKAREIFIFSWKKWNILMSFLTQFNLTWKSSATFISDEDFS